MYHNVDNMKPIAKGYLVNKKLSASQIQSALNGYSDYYKKYILGLSFSNKYMDFGNKVHELVQNTDIGVDIPKGENESNFEITLSDFPDVVLNGYLDIKSDNVVAEIKSSKDITNTDKYQLQCDFYQYVTRLPVELFIFETQEIDGVLSLTGNYKKVNHVYDEQRIKANITQALENIKAYAEKYKNETVNVDLEKLSAEYLELKSQIELLENRQDEIKELVKEKSPEGYKSENTTIFYTERKSYEYPDDIKTLEVSVKEKKKEFEKTANYETTKSITIK